jgi:hypothetical protein
MFNDMHICNAAHINLTLSPNTTASSHCAPSSKSAPLTVCDEQLQGRMPCLLLLVAVVVLLLTQRSFPSHQIICLGLQGTWVAQQQRLQQQKQLSHAAAAPQLR